MVVSAKFRLKFIITLTSKRGEGVLKGGRVLRTSKNQIKRENTIVFFTLLFLSLAFYFMAPNKQSFQRKRGKGQVGKMGNFNLTSLMNDPTKQC